MDDTMETSEVTTAQLLAHIERLEALITPMASFIEMLEAALKNHPMAKALGL
jgi:hypothetical protein